MMKRSSLFLLILCAALLLAACGGAKPAAAPAQVTPKTVTPAPAPEDTPAPAPDDAPEGGATRVTVRFLDDGAELPFHDEFVADDGEYSTKVVYLSDGEVRDVRILSLQMTDFKDGKPVFEETELYRQDTLTPDCPLVVQLTFVGDLPNNGISYVDSAGETQRFSLSTSGKDGSLFLEAY